MPRFRVDHRGGKVKEVTFHATNPSLSNPITTVHCLAFAEPGKIVLGRPPRGYDIPGGHVEPNETPLQVLAREVKEEIGASLQDEPKLVGYFRYVNHPVPTQPSICCQTDSEAGGKCRICLFGYPEVSSLPLYISLVSLDSWQGTHESTERIIIPVDQLPTQLHRWSGQLEDVLAYTKQKFPVYFDS